MVRATGGRGSRMLSDDDSQTLSRLSKDNSTKFASSKSKVTWSPARKLAFDIQERRSFGMTLGGVIAINCVCIVLETEIGARCTFDDVSKQCYPDWLRWTNAAFLVVYTAEIFLRIYTYRKAYFSNVMDMFDLTIIILGYCDAIMSLMDDSSLSGLQMLRVFRVAKLVRAARFVRLVPELHIMVRGFISSMSAMFWGFVMIILLLLFWAVIAVEFFSKVSKETHGEGHRCTEAFSGVFPAMLMFFQTLMAGDEWGACSIPLIQHQTYGAAAMIVFAGALITIQLGFTNLILAVIVERAQDAREQDKQAKIAEKQKRRRNAENRLKHMCGDMDINHDGLLSYAEIFEAYEENEDFKECLHMLEIDRGELHNLYHLMDADGSGDLSYDELIACIHKSDTNDLKRQVMVLKLQMEDIWIRTRNHLELGMSKIMQKLDVDVPDGFVVTPTPPPRRVSASSDISSTSSSDSQLHPKASACAIPTAQEEAVVQPVDLKKLNQVCEQVDADLSSLKTLSTANQQEVIHPLQQEVNQPLESGKMPSLLCLSPPQPNPSLGPTAFMHLADLKSELLELQKRLNENVVTVLDSLLPEEMVRSI